MKATGIVRRIDDLGRVVIPKEIRKTLRIKEGTPMEIYTDREGKMIDGKSRDNISVISGDMDSYCGKMIQPILCASDAIGSVILLGKNEKTILGDKERVLVRTAASFLGRQMEQ